MRHQDEDEFQSKCENIKYHNLALKTSNLFYYISSTTFVISLVTSIQYCSTMSTEKKVVLVTGGRLPTTVYL